jgi:streptogrisin C
MVLIPGLTLCASPALAADRESVADAEIQAALQRDLGLSAKEVKQQGDLQARAIKRDQQLKASLGSAYAGSIYDAKAGDLVAMVSDSKQIGKARAVGAKTKLVKHSKAKLEGIKSALDASTGKLAGTAPTERRAGEQRAMNGIVSFYVDTASNSVRVTVKKDRAKDAAASLAKYGDAVTIEQTDRVPTATADYMDGGDLIQTHKGSCSAGFNLRNPTTGQGFLLTAGHCANTGTGVSGQNNAYFGPVLESWFPGYDDAIIRNDNAGYWWQGPWVDYNPSNGGYVNVTGYTDPPLFTWMCKAGITTKWTCGTVVGKNETVNVDGVWVNHLTRHTACVEKGDSGGANVAVGGGLYSAIGVSSAAMLAPDIFSGGRLRCLGAFGLPNVSWYYPVSESLAYYGPRYGVTVW